MAEDHSTHACFACSVSVWQYWTQNRPRFKPKLKQIWFICRLIEGYYRTTSLLKLDGYLQKAVL